MRYVIGTKNRQQVLSPDQIWDGSKSFEFHIHGRSDADYATNKDNGKSISGGQVFLELSPVTFCSSTQKFVTLLVTETDCTAGMTIVQDMLYVY